MIAILFLISSNAFAMSKAVPVIDQVIQSSITSGDSTAIVEGCGQQPSPLGMFCRQVEGDATAKSVWFIGPPAKCNREACVYIKVWNGQATLVWGGSIPKDKTRVEVPWETLLARKTFELGDRGFWTFNETVYYIDSDGNEHESSSQGDILLRVFKSGYVPLHNISDDPNFIWNWIDNGFEYKMTSGLRAYVGKTK